MPGVEEPVVAASAVAALAVPDAGVAAALGLGERFGVMGASGKSRLRCSRRSGVVVMPIFFAQDFVGTKRRSIDGGVSLIVGVSSPGRPPPAPPRPGDASPALAPAIPVGPWRSKKEVAGIQPPPIRTCKPPCDTRHKIFFPLALPMRYTPGFSFTSVQSGYWGKRFRMSHHSSSRTSTRFERSGPERDGDRVALRPVEPRDVPVGSETAAPAPPPFATVLP
mmetsp:Transcript_64501/g.179477  ORF Transcript_64501/g.179477 Transcript_64501/m.179477 type:complete len:222 (-) Transcript_64501:1258-1923(-)